MYFGPLLSPNHPTPPPRNVVFGGATQGRKTRLFARAHLHWALHTIYIGPNGYVVLRLYTGLTLHLHRPCVFKERFSRNARPSIAGSRPSILVLGRAVPYLGRAALYLGRAEPSSAVSRTSCLFVGGASDSKNDIPTKKPSRQGSCLFPLSPSPNFVFLFHASLTPVHQCRLSGFLDVAPLPRRFPVVVYLQYGARKHGRGGGTWVLELLLLLLSLLLFHCHDY